MADLTHQSPAPPCPMLDIPGVATQLNMSVAAVRDLIRYGHLRAYKVGNNRNSPLRVHREDIDALLILVVPKTRRPPRFNQAANDTAEDGQGGDH